MIGLEPRTGWSPGYGKGPVVTADISGLVVYITPCGLAVVAKAGVVLVEIAQCMEFLLELLMKLAGILWCTPPV